MERSSFGCGGAGTETRVRLAATICTRPLHLVAFAGLELVLPGGA